MLMRLPYINITTTSYCIEPRKVVPKFWPVAKFGNISESPGYQISPNYVIFQRELLLIYLYMIS